MNIIWWVSGLLDLGNAVVRCEVMTQEMTLVAVKGQSCSVTQLSRKALTLLRGCSNESLNSQLLSGPLALFNLPLPSRVNQS